MLALYALGMEKPVSFRSDGQRIFGMMHLPEGAGPFPGVVFLHGFTGHRGEIHRLFVKAARALAKNRIACLRFDFRGSGESEGDFRDASVTGEIQDALKAFDFFRRNPLVNPKRMAFLGLSLGAAVASYASVRRPQVERMVLWSPLAQVERLFTGPARFSPHQIRDWVRKGHVDLNGEKMGVQWLRDTARQDPLEEAARFKGKVLIVQGSKDQATPIQQARLYLKEFGSKARLHVIAGADHTFNHFDWETEAIQTTVRWLKKNL